MKPQDFCGIAGRESYSFFYVQEPKSRWNSLGMAVSHLRIIREVAHQTGSQDQLSKDKKWVK